MKLPVPETWETQVSLKGNKAATWEQLLGKEYAVDDPTTNDAMRTIQNLLLSLSNLVFRALFSHKSTTVELLPRDELLTRGLQALTCPCVRGWIILLQRMLLGNNFRTAILIGYFSN